jgi:hypothetical protein
MADYFQIDASVRSRMDRRIRQGLALTDIAAGNLPKITPPGVHHQYDEQFHLDVGAQYALVRASGYQLVPGRVLVSNKKFRFVGQSNGWELGWNKIVQVGKYSDAFELFATQKKGSGRYLVDDGVLVSEMIMLAVRIANRQHVPSTSSRDNRKISQAVKQAVWQRDGGRCQECGANSYLEFDHVIPWTKGGASSNQ